MYKITIIAVIAIVSMAFAQPAKKDHAEKSVQKNAPKVEKPKVSNERPTASNFDQGKKGKQGNDGGSKKQSPKVQPQNPKGGNDGKGFVKIKSNDSKLVVQQSKGHGNKGPKSHKMNQPKKGNQVIVHPKNGGKIHYDKGHSGKSHKNDYKKGYPGKGHKVHYTKGHPNFGYIYINTPGYYSPRNYGQYRSKQAKNKHKHYHPVYEYQAVEGFNFIVVRNNFLYTETESKIVLVRRRLVEQRKMGAITVVEYDNSMQRVYVLEQRRAALEINISL